MKRPATSLIDNGSSKRQTSLAGFLKPKAESKPEIDVFQAQSQSSHSTENKAGEASSDSKDLNLPIRDEAESDNQVLPVIESVSNVPYPPDDHPSYHLPPSPTYNHPFPIPAIPAGLDLKFNTNGKSIVKADLCLDLLYLTRFIDPSCSFALMTYLLEALPWYRVTYTVRGVTINTPRFTTVFGKDATRTPWDGYKVAPRAIPPILLKLMQKVEQVTGETYNFTLVNYYSNGTDSISYHSDSESFLGPNPCIASLTLGGTRDFMLRHCNYKANIAPIEKFNLRDGDMVVMRGRTQHDWQHSIPKRAKAEGRINVTFRKGVVPYATKNYLDYNVGKGPMYRWIKGEMVEQT